MNFNFNRVKHYLKNCDTDPLLYCFAAGLMMLLIIENNLIISL